MQQTSKTRAMKRVLNAVALATLWLAVAGGGVTAAEPGANASGVVVLDNAAYWRHFHVEGASHMRDTNGVLRRKRINWGNGYGMDEVEPGRVVQKLDAKSAAYNATASKNPGYLGGGVHVLSGPEPASAFFSPKPPDDWVNPAFDDSSWLRAQWPVPGLIGPVDGGETSPFILRPYETAVVYARGRFEIVDPVKVKACRFSLDYWGGVVVTVNGKEVARQHLPAGAANPDGVAEDYPDEAWVLANGKLIPKRENISENRDRLKLRERHLKDVKIPAALLRKGVNVVAVEVHAAPVNLKGATKVGNEYAWPPIGLLSAELTVSPSSAGVAATPRSKGIRLWNGAPCETLTLYDSDSPAEPLRPIEISAARNSVFSGRLAVGSDQTIKGLKVTVGDLVWHPRSYSSSAKRSSSSIGRIEDEDDDENDRMNSATKIPASAVRVRYAVPASPDKSWTAAGRFDGLLDAIPPEIPVSSNAPQGQGFYTLDVQSRTATPGEVLPRLAGSDQSSIIRPWVPGAVASLWFTVRVPRDVAPGLYEGQVSISAEGLAATKVPLRVRVSHYTLPDPADWRLQNFLCHSDEQVARHYGVPRWSERHFELMGQARALMAEVNSRQTEAFLVVDYHGPDGNPESLVRWIKQADGSLKHDFTIFDKYLDRIAKSVGKPRSLRLTVYEGGLNAPASPDSVSVLDPATGKIEKTKLASLYPANVKEPGPAFWMPVFEAIRKKVEARGWLDYTTFGLSTSWGVSESYGEVARSWPGAEWSFSSHSGDRGMKIGDRVVRHASTVWGSPRPSLRRGQPVILPRPRRETLTSTYRACLNDQSLLPLCRGIGEEIVRSGIDGVSDFGVDLFPLRRPVGGYYVLAVGRGLNWGWMGRSTMALLYPGPDGPVATERFEAFREGMEVAETILYIETALAEKKLGADLADKAGRYLDERTESLVGGRFSYRYRQATEDAKLLALAGEVAKELEGKK
jgi:hypothetical protein